MTEADEYIMQYMKNDEISDLGRQCEVPSSRGINGAKCLPRVHASDTIKTIIHLAGVVHIRLLTMCNSV